MTAPASAPPPERLRVLVADDEPPARHHLRRLLEAHPDVELVGEARSGREAVASILALRPTLALLDVQMPEGTGLDAVREVAEAVGWERTPAVVFATAYDAYAVRAFELHAVDYLLKPYDAARLAEALGRVRARLRGARAARVDEGLLALLERADREARYLRRLSIRVGPRVRLVDVDAVDYFEADGNYVRVHLGASSELMRESLTALGERLDPRRFVRVHRSLVVNVRRVAEVEPLFAGEYVLFLQGGRRLTTGRTYRAAVQQALGLRP
jgi:two-component system LytT family response regulator